MRLLTGFLVLSFSLGALGVSPQSSLSYVYYAGNPLPPPPTSQEVEEARRWLEASPVSEGVDEVELLRRLYGNSPQVVAYALRDSDGDGIRDYRISHYGGKFYEGDVDVDGDAIHNGVDAFPYDPTRGGVDLNGDGLPDRDFDDEDKDGIPDVVDFTGPDCNCGPDWRSLYQEWFYKNWKVILVDRDNPFSPGLAKALYDVASVVFAHVIPKGVGTPALRVIASERNCLLAPDSTLAMTLSQNQTMTFYQAGLALPPVVLLALATHEMAHVVQYQGDWKGLATEQREDYFNLPKFFTRMATLGWSVDTGASGTWHPFKLFSPAFGYEFFSPSFTWKGRSPEQWKEYLNLLRETHGAKYLELPEIQALGIVGAYSLTDPLEYEAESVSAGLLLRLWKLSTAAQKEKLEREVSSHWKDYRFLNQQGQPQVASYLGAAYPWKESDLRKLIR